MEPSRRRAQALLSALLLFAWRARSGVGSRVEGVLPRSRDFAHYAGKFCFDFGNESEDQTVGKATVDLMREGEALKDAQQGQLFFMIFDDERHHWKKASRRWSTSSCESKKADASLVTELDLRSPSPNFTFNIGIKEHIRPRFWYFTFVACEGLDLASLPVRYSVHATNDGWGWQKEFSLDHMGLLRFYICLTVLFCLAGLATAWGSRWRQAAQDPPLREHPYIQLLTLAYLASAASCSLFLGHYGLFIHNGFGSLRIRFLAVLAGIVANCTIYLIAILASSSWAISTFQMQGRHCFLGLIGGVGLLHALCELHAEMLVDQSTQLYSYQGLGGAFTLMLKIFMFCWFVFQVKTSHDEVIEEKLRRFFKILGFGFSVWSINVPVTVVLAFLISPWYRYKVVTVVDVTARFLGLCLLSQLFCGPLSPITKSNVFVLKDMGGPHEEEGFIHLADKPSLRVSRTDF